MTEETPDRPAEKKDVKAPPVDKAGGPVAPAHLTHSRMKLMGVG